MKAYLKENHSSKFGNLLVFTVAQNKITDPDFTWETENEEFRYRQDLYDVVSVEKKAGKLEIVCLKDANENQLENHLNEIHKLNKNNSSRSNQNSVKFFSVFYLQKQDNYNLEIKRNNLPNHSFSATLSYSFLAIQSPPPRC